jgi:hypothetical protein
MLQGGYMCISRHSLRKTVGTIVDIYLFLVPVGLDPSTLSIIYCLLVCWIGRRDASASEEEESQRCISYRDNNYINSKLTFSHGHAITQYTDLGIQPLSLIRFHRGHRVIEA